MGNLHLVTGRAGTAHITAADHGSLNAAIFGEGGYVLNRGSKFAATVVSNNKIRVADGDIIMQGRHIRLGNSVDLSIDNGSQGVNRNDLIVVRYTRNGTTGIEDSNLVVIKGSETSGNALDPEYNDNSTIFDGADLVDMPLYRVRLNGISVAAVEAMFEVRSLGNTQDMTRNFACATGSAESLAIAKGSMTMLDLDTWKHNSNDVFTFASGGVRIPSDGTVLIYASVYFNTSSTTKPEQLCVHVKHHNPSNPTGAEIGGQTTYCVSHTACHLSPIMAQVAAGDILTLHVRNMTASGTCIPNAKATGLTVIYL